MQENSNSTITQQECLIKSEHLILEKKPYILITYDDTKDGFISSVYIHTANVKGTRQKLDLSLLEFTHQINPITKLTWAMMNQKKLIGGDNEHEGD